jgi:hypothetical protein
MKNKPAPTKVATMPSSINEGQRHATHCYFCGHQISRSRDGRAWINGFRVCLPCATGGTKGVEERSRSRKLRGYAT